MVSDILWWLGLGLDRHACFFFFLLFLKIVCFYLNHFICIYTKFQPPKRVKFSHEFGLVFWSCFDLIQRFFFLAHRPLIFYLCHVKHFRLKVCLHALPCMPSIWLTGSTGTPPQSDCLSCLIHWSLSGCCLSGWARVLPTITLPTTSPHRKQHIWTWFV